MQCLCCRCKIARSASNGGTHLPCYPRGCCCCSQCHITRSTPYYFSVGKHASSHRLSMFSQPLLLQGRPFSPSINPVNALAVDLLSTCAVTCFRLVSLAIDLCHMLLTCADLCVRIQRAYANCSSARLCSSKLQSLTQFCSSAN